MRHDLVLLVFEMNHSPWLCWCLGDRKDGLTYWGEGKREGKREKERERGRERKRGERDQQEKDFNTEVVTNTSTSLYVHVHTHIMSSFVVENNVGCSCAGLIIYN